MNATLPVIISLVFLYVLGVVNTALAIVFALDSGDGRPYYETGWRGWLLTALGAGLWPVTALVFTWLAVLTVLESRRIRRIRRMARS